MATRRLFVLLLLASPLTAQYANVSVSGVIPTANGPSNTVTFGSWFSNLTVEYTPPPPTTITVTPDQFTTFPAGRIVARAIGNPGIIPTSALTLTFRTAASPDIVEINCFLDTSYLQNLPVAVLRCSPYDVGTISGTHFSIVAQNTPIPLTSPTSREVTIDLTAQATSGVTVLDAPTLYITYTPGTASNTIFSYRSVSKARFIARDLIDFIFVTALTPTTGVVQIGAQQGPVSCTCYTFLRVPGVPPVRLDVIINGDVPQTRLTASPPVLNFWYERGQPAPADQQVTVTASQPATLTPYQYDNSFSITPTGTASAPVTYNVHADLQNKPAGTISTGFQIYGSPYVSFVNIPVNLYIADGPGFISSSVSPANAGVIRFLPERSSYRNGDFIEASATPAPGYRFLGWGGTRMSGQPTFSFYLNGPTYLTAIFVADPCPYSVSPAYLDLPATGDAATINIKTQPGCPWFLSQFPSWLTLRSPAAGTGTGAISYTVPTNPSNLARSGSLRIAGQEIPASQPGRACRTYLPTTNSSTFEAASGAIPYLGDYLGECPQETKLSSYWLSNGYTAAGIAIIAEPNPTGRPRIASFSLGGIRFPLIQKSSPNTTPFADAIALLQDKAILDLTANPDAPVTQASLATTIIRALYGDVFPYSATPAFADVPVSHPAFRYIQKLSELNITPGCGSNNFCPAAIPTRAQIAELIVRARARLPLGQTPPFRPQPFFTDADDRNPAFPFIQKLREWGITSGCAPQRFCPTDPVTLGQSALLLARAFLAP